MTTIRTEAFLHHILLPSARNERYVFQYLSFLREYRNLHGWLFELDGAHLAASNRVISSFFVIGSPDIALGDQRFKNISLIIYSDNLLFTEVIKILTDTKQILV